MYLVSENNTNTTAPSSTVVQHGEQLEVECQPHYEFLNSFTPVVCNNGTWTNIPKCEPARFNTRLKMFNFIWTTMLFRCKHLPKPPKNGMVIAPKMEHNMKARFKCKDGFKIQGREFIECSYGNWTGEIPICQEGIY